MSSEHENMSYLEGFTNADETCTSSNIDILKRKLLKISERHMNAANISLLVKGSLKYIDFLLQSPESLHSVSYSHHKRDIRDYFSVLGDIGRKNELKNKFLEEIAVPILERIIDPSVSSLFGQELASNLNKIARNSERDIRNRIVQFSARIYIYKLMDLIEICGDYEYQMCLVETFFRMCSSDYILKHVQDFFPSANNLQECLLNIKANDFDRSLRKFLNAVNCINRNIYSIAASSASLDEFIIEAPVTNGVDKMELWIDFNIIAHTIGIFCNENSFVLKSNSQEDGWELLTFFVEDISLVQLKRKKINSKGSFVCSVLFHKKTSCHYTYDTSAEAAAANTLKLIIQSEVVDDLEEVLLQMFKEKFETYNEASQNSQIEYFTEELLTRINDTDKKHVSSDSQSEKSYAKVLLCRTVDNINNCVSVEDKPNIINKKYEFRVCNNKIVNHTEDNKENVECYFLSAQENVNNKNTTRRSILNEFKETGEKLNIVEYYTPELIQSVSHVNKSYISTDGHSTISYAHVLLDKDVDNIIVKNTTHKEDNRLRVFTSKEVIYPRGDKENVESMASAQEEDALDYCIYEENAKSETASPLSSPEFTAAHRFIKSTETDIVPRENKLKNLENEHGHSISAEFIKCNTTKRNKQSIKINVPFNKFKENVNENTELSFIEGTLQQTLPENVDNEKLNDETSNKLNLMNYNRIETVTCASKSESPKNIKLKVYSNKVTTTTVQQKEHDMKNEMGIFQGEEVNECQFKKSDGKKMYPVPSTSEHNLEDNKQNFTSEHVTVSMPVVIVQRCNFEKFLSKKSSQRKKETCVNAKETDDASICSSIFMASTQKIDSQEYIQDVNDILMELNQENSELKQKEFLQVIRANDLNEKHEIPTNAEQNVVETFTQQTVNPQKTVLGSVGIENKENDSQFILKTHLIESVNSFLGTTEIKLHETMFDQPSTVVSNRKKRKLYTQGDLSYLETTKDSIDSDVTASKTIITTALIHEPVRHTLQRKQNQTILKNNVTLRDLDSINVIEHCSQSFNKENISNTKEQRHKQENMRKIETIKLNNEKNNECYLLNQKINLPSDNNTLITTQREPTTLFHSTVNDKSPKKNHKSRIFKSKNKFDKTEQEYLQDDSHINFSTKFNNYKDIEKYIIHTSCFNNELQRWKRKSIKSNNVQASVVKLQPAMRKRREIYSGVTSAKRKRIFNEYSANNAKKMKRKKSNIKTINNAYYKVEKNATPKVKILQNVVLHTAPNLIHNNTNNFDGHHTEEQEYIQSNNFMVDEKPATRYVESWLQTGYLN